MPLCPFRDSHGDDLPEVMPERGDLWRLTDGHLARVLGVWVTMERRLSFVYVTTRMRTRNVPLAAFWPPARRCEQPALW
jgi:hypothetical protein